MNIVVDRRKPCPVPWQDLSPLVREAINMGLVVRSVTKLPGQARQEAVKRRPLPAGHRFYQGKTQEVEARVLEWLIRKHPDNCWFMTLTFKDYTQPDKADRMLRSYLGRLSQAHNAIPGAALLKRAARSDLRQPDSPAQSSRDGVEALEHGIGLISVATTEWQQRDVIHYHLLTYGDRLGCLSRKRWELRWRVMSGGFAAIYDAELKAAPYLVKHQIKDRPGGNLHLGGAWRGITPPRSVSCEAHTPNGSRDVATAFHHANIATALENSC